MIAGSLHDTHEGGFVRYCTDRAWQHPVSGKMLYDNALMTGLLLEASEVLGEPRFATVAMQTAAWMRDKLMLDGLFCALYEEGVIKDAQRIVSWNAMAITAFFAAASHDEKHGKIALKSLQRLLEHGMRKGVLCHLITEGEVPVVEGFLEDYAYVAEALWAAYRYTGEAHYLDKATEVINRALRVFFNAGNWYYAREPEALLDTPADGNYPSALAVMASVLLSAGREIDPGYKKFLDRTLEVHSYTLMRQPVSIPLLTKVAIENLPASSAQ